MKKMFMILFMVFSISLAGILVGCSGSQMQQQQTAKLWVQLAVNYVVQMRDIEQQLCDDKKMTKCTKAEQMEKYRVLGEKLSAILDKPLPNTTLEQIIAGVDLTIAQMEADKASPKTLLYVRQIKVIMQMILVNSATTVPVPDPNLV